MKPNETADGPQPTLNGRGSHSRYKYRKVPDGRKLSICGLDRDGMMNGDLILGDIHLLDEQPNDFLRFFVA